jgi:penicillin-binding protein 2
VQLTLDLRIQKVVERLMTGTEEKPINGSAVVIKVQTGEILAMTSKPSFDPNLFSAGISVAEWHKLLFNNQHPLQNRAIDGQYPPGSVYKIVAAYAVLEEEAMAPEDTVFCPGYFRLGRRVYRCWRKGGHGEVDLHDALVQSCDVYFYTVGHKLGIDTLARYAKMLGMGSLTQINLIGEKPGLVPTKDWKLKARGEEWLGGETISASIGQGFNLVTPIQQARLVATVANGGIVLKPYLVRQIKDKDGRVVKEFFPSIEKRLESRPDTLSIIQKGLFGVVNEKRGTGWRARLKKIKVAGKTGTAQVVALKADPDSEEEDEIPYQHRDHAWFVGYAPYENPEIAVVVIVEHGGHGGSAAAPIVRKIIQTYNKYYPQIPFEEETREIPGSGT